MVYREDDDPWLPNSTPIELTVPSALSRFKRMATFKDLFYSNLKNTARPIKLTNPPTNSTLPGMKKPCLPHTTRIPNVAAAISPSTTPTATTTSPLSSKDTGRRQRTPLTSLKGPISMTKPSLTPIRGGKYHSLPSLPTTTFNLFQKSNPLSAKKSSLTPKNVPSSTNSSTQIEKQPSSDLLRKSAPLRNLIILLRLRPDLILNELVQSKLHPKINVHHPHPPHAEPRRSRARQFPLRP